MGGSSGPPGGGYVPRNLGLKTGVGSGGQPDGDDPCSFSIRTSLASPVPKVVSSLAPGHFLKLFLNEGGPAPIVEVRVDNGEVAGTIAGIPNLRALVGCMKLGVAYQFTVNAISGGRVDGTVRNS